MQAAKSKYALIIKKSLLALAPRQTLLLSCKRQTDQRAVVAAKRVASVFARSAHMLTGC